MSIELKVKAKHLAVEAQIIRFEEQKAKKQADWKRQRQQLPVEEMKIFFNLKHHRIWDVRNEVRATQLARAFIAGNKYSNIESNRKPENEWKFKTAIIPRVTKMVQKYGGRDNRNITKEQILDWVGS